MRVVSVIIPAHNEASCIGRCLQGLLQSDPVQHHKVEVIVVANGCTDDTAERAWRFAELAQARGWTLHVIELQRGSKIAALNAGDARAIGGIRVYLDADVTVSPALLGEIIDVLSVEKARYATGTAKIALPRSRVIHAYAGFWQRLPFVQSNAAGFGIYAVNAEGRARWDMFPDIISDDTFVRLSFAPSERVQVTASHTWPMAEDLLRLVKVRRRQDLGVRQLLAKFPHLQENDDTPRPDLPALMRQDPKGFLVYAGVALAVLLSPRRNAGQWARGRAEKI